MERKTNRHKNGTAVAYFRQSSGNDDVSLSIADQIVQCRKWAVANGIRILKEFADFNTPGELYPNTPEARAFCITDKSWQNWRKSRAFTKDYRKQLGELFVFLKYNSVDYVIVHERTRLYRSPNNSFLDGFITNELAEKKIAIVDVTSGKIDNLDNVIDIAVQKLLATYEMSKIDEKAAQSKRVRAEKKAKGEYYSNAFGVRWQEKKIFFPETHRDAIKMIFRSVAEGKSYGWIRNTLNTLFFHLRSERRRKRARCFYETNIYNVLKNPVYCGYFIDNGEYRPITNLGSKPIISLRHFLEIQKLVAHRKGKNSRQKSSSCHEQTFLPLSGLLTCGNCGRRLTVAQDNGIVYFCKNTLLLKDKNCTPSRIRFFSGKNDGEFLFSVQALFPVYLHHYYHSLKLDCDIRESITSLAAEISTHRKTLENMMDLYFNGAVDLETFQKKNAEFSAAIREKEVRLLELQDRIKEANDNQLDDLMLMLEKFNSSRQLLEQDHYFMLARETIRNIAVFSDRITFTLFDEKIFSLPRISGPHRTKKTPAGSFRFETEQGFRKPVVTFTCPDAGKTADRDTVLLDTCTYRILLRT